MDATARLANAEATGNTLLNAFQRDFPLEAAPYAAVARSLGTSEAAVLATLRDLMVSGSVARVGAVFRAGSVGASTLAAMAVPPARLASVARSVNAHPGVNHNYEREHRFNLWFVVHARDADDLGALLRTIEREAVLPVIALPLLREYHIDLGFDLGGEGVSRGHRRGQRAPSTECSGRTPREWSDEQTRIFAALQDGLALVTRPFSELAARAHVAGDDAEGRVLSHVRNWVRHGIIKRFGLIVRHRALGFHANVMAVWDVPDEAVDAFGERFATEPAVTLCYRRRRALPAWPYNLFCMLHGRDRDAVNAELDRAAIRCGLRTYPHARLFSRTAFKQEGARHFAATAHG